MERSLDAFAGLLALPYVLCAFALARLQAATRWARYAREAPLDLGGRLALVTGGSLGIGEACAKVSRGVGAGALRKRLGNILGFCSCPAAQLWSCDQAAMPSYPTLKFVHRSTRLPRRRHQLRRGDVHTQGRVTGVFNR